MRKLLKLSMAAIIGLSLFGCSSTPTSNQQDNDSKPKEGEKENKIYGIGDKVTYSEDGKDLVSLTINSVTTTEERNQFSDKQPSQVVVINYTYENIASEKDVYISTMYFTVIDSSGNVCETYPAGTNVAPQPTPLGAKSDGEEAYGLKETSDTIKFRFKYGYGNAPAANFELKVD